MKIWIFNNYNMLPEQGQLTRSFYFGKYLKQFGHEPVVFVGSHPHNTDLQLITGHEKFRQYENCEFPWVLVKTCNYEGSKIKRVFAMFQYCQNLYKAAKAYEKPAAIVGSSAHPFAAVMAILLGRKYHCKKIVEIRDLWPESIVAYGVASKNNPLVKLLYRLEKWLYTKADAIIFTMEGGKDYIVEQGWDTAHGGPVDLNKVHHINNGVDLEVFDYNKEHYAFADPDLDEPDTFKIVYAGSIRKANRSIMILPEVAKELQNLGRDDIRIFVYGKGDCLDAFLENCKLKGVNNLIYKGFVGKEKIPYIVSKANVNILNCDSSEMSKYGSSQNKLFEYLASGRPILSGESDRYSIIINRCCGISKHFENAKEIAESLIELVDHGEKYTGVRSVGEEYDFRILTDKLIEILR